MQQLINQLTDKKMRSQLISYALVGIASNAAGYLIYLLLTYFWPHPKLSMSILYVVGATVSYLGNKSLTFRHTGGHVSSGIRYLLAHLAGYAMNLGLLTYFVDVVGLPHQLVQASSIFIVAAFLFVAFKFFVFPPDQNGGPA
jgi:putative flippase GtrA